MNKLLLTLPVVTLAACQPQEPARVYYPVEVCGDVRVPVYGVLDRPASGGEVVGGAVVGGVIGNAIGDEGGAVVGAIIGGAIANDTRRQEQVITGYRTEYQCRIEYK